MENSSPMMNLHEMVFHSFITKECPTFMADKLIYLFRVIMMVFNAGSVNYNAIMISNTLMVDFFMRNHRLLVRGLSFGFIDQVLFRLLNNDRYWYFLNNLNPHLFYLNYRTKIMNIICHQMAKMYGSETFNMIFHRISAAVRGRERDDYPSDLGKLFIFLPIMRSTYDSLSVINFILFILIAVLNRAWNTRITRWIEKMGPMYPENSYYDEAVSVSCLSHCKYFDLPHSVFLIFVQLFSLEHSGGFQESATYGNPSRRFPCSLFFCSSHCHC